MIIVTDRILNIPRDEQIVGFTGDNLVETRVFELSRTYGDIDLSLFDFKLDTQVGKVKNIIDLAKVVAEETITLTWTIEESHVLYSGYMAIQVRAFHGEVEKWHSAQEYVLVMPSINPAAAQPDVLPSEFEQMEQRVTAMKNQAQEAAQTAEQQADRAQGIADTFENTTLPAAITAVGAAVDEQVDIAASHADRAQGIADTFSNTTLPAAISAVEAAGQAKVDLAEQQAERVEDIIREAEQDVLPELRQAIEDGIETKDQLGGSIQEAGEAKTALDGSISAAGPAKTGLDGSISSAGVTKTQLDGSISSANGIKSQLDGSITAAGQAKELLDESIATGDLAAFKAEFETHKTDYATYKDSTNLKIFKVEKELNDYQQTMASMNVNQEVKQKATGYGIVSLPKNAANGQFSDVSVRGQSYTNIFGSDGRGDNASIFFSTPPNTLVQDGDMVKATFNGNLELVRINRNLKGEFSGKICGIAYIENYTDKTVVLKFRNYGSTIESVEGSFIPANTKGRAIVIMNASDYANATVIHMRVDVSRDSTVGGYVKVKHFMLIDLTNELETDANKLLQKYTYIDGTKSTVSAMRLKSVGKNLITLNPADWRQGGVASATGAKGDQATDYEPYTESTQYVVAKDEQGNIAELRSLPNGTKDEISVTNRKLIKRIGEKSNIANGMVIDFADMAEGGTYYAWNEDGETETGIKGDTLGIDATTLTYQLATPIEIPIQTSGSLVSYPSGTVYIEPYVADAGIYVDKMEVLYSDLPIKTLEKISKVDFDTGFETELDITAAVIAEDKLSFTHPDLVEGDIVFFVYEYDQESTEGETEIEYYDSRYAIKDSVTEKFYKWHIAVAEGVPSIELVEV
jgi:hypothetical protein